MWKEFDVMNEDTLIEWLESQPEEGLGSSYIYLGKPDMVHDRTLSYDFIYLDARGIQDAILGELLQRKAFERLFIDNRFKNRFSDEQRQYILSLKEKLPIVFVEKCKSPSPVGEITNSE